MADAADLLDVAAPAALTQAGGVASSTSCTAPAGMAMQRTWQAFCLLTLLLTLTLRAALRCRRRASAGDTPLLLKASPAHALAKHVAAACKVRSHSMAAQHGASRGCRHRRVAAAAGCVTSANARADHACGNRTQHAAPGMTWPTTGRRTDSCLASTALLLRTPPAPATRCCTCERHLRALAREAALDSIASHAACACCHKRGGACRAVASASRCCCSGHHLQAHLCALPAGSLEYMLKPAAYTGGVPPPAGAWLTPSASIWRAAPACTAVR